MNRLSSHRTALWYCPQAALFLLLAALPGAAPAQKPAAPPPAVTPAASSPAPGPSLALSQKEALSQKQMLDADKRLDRPVTLDVISVPLDEVLQKQSVDKSADTKPAADKKGDPDRLVLTASHNCADLKLQIRLNHRPLRTLMQALAEMLPGAWTRTREGYNLSLTDKAVLARAEWWRLFLGEREKALALQRQAVLAAMQTKGYRRKDSDPDPEQSDRAAEKDTADQHDFFHSLPQALKEQIAANIDDSAFYDMDSGYGNGGEKTGTVGWLSQMAPETQERFKTALQDNITNHLAGAPPALQGYTQQAQRDLAAFDPSKVYFLFQNGGSVVLASPFNGPPSASTILSLSVPTAVSALPLMLDQKRLAEVVYGGADIPPHWKQKAEALRKMGDAVPPVWKQLVYEVYGMGDAAPLEWRQLADYQRGRVWPNALPKLPPEEYSDGQPVISRAAQTDWLGERGGMEYVCDYYCDYLSHGGYAMPEAQRKLPVRRPLATEMDEMAARRDVSWKKDEDGITLIRNNRWYRDDNLEVPEPLLRRWFGMLLQTRQRVTAQAAILAAAQPATPPSAPQAGVQAAARPAPPMITQSPEERVAALKQNWDWAAEVVGALTPWQIQNGLALFQPEERDLAAQSAASEKQGEDLKRFIPPSGGSYGGGMIVAMGTHTPPFRFVASALKRLRHTTQLYGSLEDMGRVALLDGRLPASALSASQLTQALSLQPMLPQALQSFPATSVFLGLLPGDRLSPRIAFPELPSRGLEVFTPPPNAP